MFSYGSFFLYDQEIFTDGFYIFLLLLLLDPYLFFLLLCFLSIIICCPGLVDGVVDFEIDVSDLMLWAVLPYGEELDAISSNP